MRNIVILTLTLLLRKSLMKKTLPHAKWLISFVKLVAIVVAIASHYPSFAKALTEAGPPLAIQSGELANGLRVMVIENHRIPLVNTILLYHAGAMDDPAGKSGLAHVLEHMMFKGTKKTPDGGFSRIVAGYGGEENAFTTQDATAYYHTIARDYWADVLALEADRMRNLDFASQAFRQEFTTEVKVVIEERNQRTENNPMAKLMEQMEAGFFLNHPYRKPIIGWPGELENLSIQDLQQFYNQYYHPDNAILVVSGDVQFSEVMDLAKRLFGLYAKGPPRNFPSYGKPPYLTHNQYDYSDPLVKVPRLIVKIPTPTLGSSANQAETEQILALNLGLEALAGDDSSPLYRRLVIERKLAVSVAVGQDLFDRGPGAISIYATPASGVSLEDLQNALSHELALMVKTGLSEEEIERARIRLRDSQLLQRDNLSHVARMVALLSNIGLPLDTISQWPQPIIQQQRATVNQVLNDWLVLGQREARGWQAGYLRTVVPEKPDVPEKVELQP